MFFDEVQRRLAIAALLDQPDPPELRRGHRLRIEGKPERLAMLAELAAIHMQGRLIALEERRIAAAECKPTEREDIRWSRHAVRRAVPVPA